MAISYYGILRGLVLPMEFSAIPLLKGSDDCIFMLETNQMSGYTTKETLSRMIKRELDFNANDEAINALLDELKEFKINEDFSHASIQIQEGTTFLEWLGIS